MVGAVVAAGLQTRSFDSVAQALLPVRGRSDPRISIAQPLGPVLL